MIATKVERAVVATYSSQAAAEVAVRRLQLDGIASERLSIIGSKWEAREALQGHWNLPEWEKAGLEKEGEREGFWVGSLFGMLEGFAFFLVPALGPIVVLGPVAGFLFGGGLGMLVGWAFGEATAEEISSRYRERLASGHFLVVAMCMADEEAGIRSKLELVHPDTVEGLPVKAWEGASKDGPTMM